MIGTWNLECIFPMCIRQIWCSNFENLTFWPTYGRKTAKKWRPYWNFRGFLAIKWPKSNNLKIATTSNFWNTIQGKYIPNFKSIKCLLFIWVYFLWNFSIAIWRFCTYCIYRQIWIFTKSKLRLGIIFFHADFCIFFISTSSKLEITQLVFGSPDPPCSLNMCVCILKVISEI